VALTRRGLIAGGGAVAVGALVGRESGGRGGGVGPSVDGGAGAAGSVPFHGRYQAGIATPAQDRLQFAAFDVTVDRANGLRDLLRTWTAAAARMTAGDAAGELNSVPLAPPDDTGEAFGLPPSQLTITFGLGPSLFEKDGRDRFGLRSRRPAALRQLPPLPGDELEPDRSGGDLCVQACANDPQVAFHAVRNLARLARGAAVMRWSQLGFGRTSTTSRSQSTPRNLMGFKDGTANIRAEDTKAMDEHVWTGPDERPGWMRDGTYLVARRIRMLIEVWDRASLQDQEQTIGRHKMTGAPIGGRQETDPLDLAKHGPSGAPLIPAGAHVRLAHPSNVDGGARILRRGYSFTDGIDAGLGQLDAGLFFIAFQRDPATGFLPIQRSLASADALNEYITHTSSAVFAVPGGVRPGGYVAERLFTGG
jgi:deferrochelatase/peroxidase EfeB